jgi:CheY-like chemotaxis protein
MTGKRAILFIGSAEAHCVGRMLIASGYTVKSASTVPEVAKFATELRLAAVVMDLDLPKTELFACVK